MLLCFIDDDIGAILGNKYGSRVLGVAKKKLYDVNKWKQ
jgi:hypothetical protein